jgi:hypothetical protein
MKRPLQKSSLKQVFVKGMQYSRVKHKTGFVERFPFLDIVKFEATAFGTEIISLRELLIECNSLVR